MAEPDIAMFRLIPPFFVLLQFTPSSLHSRRLLDETFAIFNRRTARKSALQNWDKLEFLNTPHYNFIPFIGKPHF